MSFWFSCPFPYLEFLKNNVIKWWCRRMSMIVCLFVFLFICLSRLKFWQLLSWCGPAIPTHTLTNDSRNTGNFMPHSSRIVCTGSLTSHIKLVNMEGICEMGPTVYSPYPRRLESLTICRCNYKGSTFSSVILRPWVMVRPESNLWPPALQPDAQPTEPPYY